MAIETILGGVVGGALRIAPEILSIWDKKNERKHELAMQEFSLKRTQLENEGKLAVVDREVEGKQFEAAMAVMKEAHAAQGRPTGIRFVDGWAAAIRPAVTSWVFLLYAAVKAATISLAVKADVPIDAAVIAMWGPEDSAMLSAILTFWFLGRVWERVTPRVVPK